MELHIRIEPALESTPKSLLDEQDGVGSSQPSSLPLPHAPQYNIARDRERRQVIHQRGMLRLIWLLML